MPNALSKHVIFVQNLITIFVGTIKNKMLLITTGGKRGGGETTKHKPKYDTNCVNLPKKKKTTNCCESC